MSDFVNGPRANQPVAGGPSGLVSWFVVSSDPTGVIAKPAGTIAYLIDRSKGWVNYDGTASGWADLLSLATIDPTNRWLKNSDGGAERPEDFVNGFGGALRILDQRTGRYYRLMVATDDADFATSGKPRWFDLTGARDVLGVRACAGLEIATNMSLLHDNDQVQVPDYAGGFHVLEIQRTNAYVPTPGAVTIDGRTWTSAADAIVHISGVHTGGGIAAYGWTLAGINGGPTKFTSTLLAPHVGAKYNGGANPWGIFSPAGGITFEQPDDGADGLAMIEPGTQVTNLVTLVDQGPDRVIFDVFFDGVSEVVLPDLKPECGYKFVVRVSDQNSEAPYMVSVKPAIADTQAYYLSAAATVPASHLLISRGDANTPPTGTGELGAEYHGIRDWHAWGQVFPHVTTASFAAFGGVSNVEDAYVGWKVVLETDLGPDTATGHLLVVEQHKVTR